MQSKQLCFTISLFQCSNSHHCKNKTNLSCKRLQCNALILNKHPTYYSIRLSRPGGKLFRMEITVSSLLHTPQLYLLNFFFMFVEDFSLGFMTDCSVNWCGNYTLIYAIVFLVCSLFLNKFVIKIFLCNLIDGVI